jgi:hypothetical protein
VANRTQDQCDASALPEKFLQKFFAGRVQSGASPVMPRSTTPVAGGRRTPGGPPDGPGRGAVGGRTMRGIDRREPGGRGSVGGRIGRRTGRPGTDGGRERCAPRGGFTARMRYASGALGM